jgi:hypothetical protein
MSGNSVIFDANMRVCQGRKMGLVRTHTFVLWCQIFIRAWAGVYFLFIRLSYLIWLTCDRCENAIGTYGFSHFRAAAENRQHIWEKDVTKYKYFSYFSFYSSLCTLLALSLYSTSFTHFNPLCTVYMGKIQLVRDDLLCKDALMQWHLCLFFAKSSNCFFE